MADCSVLIFDIRRWPFIWAALELSCSSSSGMIWIEEKFKITLVIALMHNNSSSHQSYLSESIQCIIEAVHPSALLSVGQISLSLQFIGGQGTLCSAVEDAAVVSR